MTLPARTTTFARDTAVWLSAHGADILLGLVAAAILVVALLALRSLGIKLCRHDAPGRWRQIAGETLAKTSPLFMAALAAKLVASQGEAPPVIGRAAQIAFVVAFAIQAAIWGRAIILGIVDHRAGAEPGETAVGNAIGIIRLLVNVTLFTIAIVLILSNLGVDVTGIVAGLGIGGIAIGLAAKDVFSDLFAALSILFDKPFRRGQTIRVGDTVGTVEAIGLKTTRLRSVDGDEVILSNAKLLEREIRNLADVHDRRVLLTLPLLNRNDPAVLATLPAMIQNIVEAEPDCRFIHAVLTGFGANTADMEIIFRIDTTDFERMAAVRHSVVLAILTRLKVLGLELTGPWPA